MKYTAVIDIGSTAIRMNVMEYSKAGQSWRILEQAERMVNLGKDILEGGTIQSETLTEVIQHIKGFQEIYSTYPVKNVFLLGSYAIKEADNAELLQDRIFMDTELKLRLLGGMESNQLRYLALARTMEARELTLDQCNSLIIDVGSSSSEVMYLENGRMTWCETLPIGILRETNKLPPGPENWGEDLGQRIEVNTRRVLMQFAGEYNLQRVDQMILMGRDIRILAPHMGDELEQGSYRIKAEEFTGLLNSLKEMPFKELMNRFSLNYHKAAALLPALYIISNVYKLTSAEQLLVPPASTMEGVQVQMVSSPKKLKSLFKNQIIASAWSLAKHYHVDLDHAGYVSRSALQIYRFICDNRKIKNQSPVLLEAAGILHDIGTYIGGRGHHKHSQYLIENSTLFGLTEEQTELLGYVVRYHRKAIPNRSHRGYMSLSRNSRITIQQLAAILRVADSLDRAHQQRIVFDLSIKQDQLIIRNKNSHDISLERESLKVKADLFRNIFGLRVILQ